MSAVGRTPGASGSVNAPTVSADTNLPRIRAYILLALAVGSGYLLVRMLWPFLPAVVTSTVVAVLVFPAFQMLRRRIRNVQVVALLTTVVVFFLILLPTLGLALLLLDQVRAGLVWIADGAADVFAPAGSVRQWFERAAAYLGFDSGGVGSAISAQSQALVATLADRTLALFTGLGGWLLQAGVALFTLFYLLRDGERLVGHLKWLIPLDPELNDRLFRQARDVTYATIYGNVAVAAIQGILGGVAFLVLGLPVPVVWGTVMGVLSLLPVVGAFFIWLPAGVLLLVTGEFAKGLILLAVGTLLISTIDNVLRAILVGERAELHPLVVFFSVLGGLFVFGAVGVFVGPVLFVTALMLIEMARLSLEGTATTPPDVAAPASAPSARSTNRSVPAATVLHADPGNARQT